MKNTGDKRMIYSRWSTGELGNGWGTLIHFEYYYFIVSVQVVFLIGVSIFDLESDLHSSRHEPIGVVGQIIPWVFLNRSSPLIWCYDTGNIPRKILQQYIYSLFSSKKKLLMWAWKLQVGPALATGNTIVMKVTHISSILYFPTFTNQNGLFPASRLFAACVPSFMKLVSLLVFSTASPDTDRLPSLPSHPTWRLKKLLSLAG